MTPPAAASARTAAPLAPGRRFGAPARPRRVSGPVRAPGRGAAARPAPVEGGGLVIGALGALEALSSHRMLDRLIRGRLWIGIVAFALIGIVTLQLGLLKLNSSIGRALEKQSLLQRENAALSIENSELAGGNRVESQAERLGMKLVPVGGIDFRASHARTDVPRAVQALASPAKPAEASSASSSESSASSSSESESSSSEQSSTQSSTGGSESSGETSSSESSEGTASSGSTAAGETPSTSAGAATEPASSATATQTEAGGGTAAPGG